MSEQTAVLMEEKIEKPLENKERDTPQTRMIREKFHFFGAASFLYACFYAFCMFHNPSGITFPFFIAGSLLFFCLCFSKLGISLKKGSTFYLVSIMLLAISTLCTDDGRMISMNKIGIFFLMLSLLLNQFYNTAKWQLGKYLGSIFTLIFASIGEWYRPFKDGNYYRQNCAKHKNSSLFYILIGTAVSIPLLLIVLALLSSADAVFRSITRRLLEAVNISNVFQVTVMVTIMFFGVYGILSYLSLHKLKEETKNTRRGEPMLAITVTALLTLLYLVFSVIQIVYLFMGQMQLPAGYTYAEYAREGFFQLLAVSILNLIIVLCAMAYFRENVVLKVVLTIMSLCTFIMIASSTMRMIIYIQYYYLTFLRIFVLWCLLVLFLLFTGVIAGIYRKGFPLFRYSVAVITVCYLLLSFSHPDYWIAKVNVANIPDTVSGEAPQSDFFKGEGYEDDYYLTLLCADAAPVLVPYYAQKPEYQFDIQSCYEFIHSEEYREVYYDDDYWFRGVGYFARLGEKLGGKGLRSWNISRFTAERTLEKTALTLQ